MISIKNKSFDYLNFDIDNYSLFSIYEIVISKFSRTVHRLRSKAQSSVCSTYGKYLWENIIAELTPKSGIESQTCFNQFPDLFSAFAKTQIFKIDILNAAENFEKEAWC